ncbi:unnamed protein product [Rotaria sp. Silwood2]|nr:unnamed protein product [Rotaria sp. Silwood2]
MLKGEVTAVHLNRSHHKHDYINANEIRGVNSLKQYIACQSPLMNTCEDFWDMIIQYRIPKIVMLNQFDQADQQNPSASSKCYPYFPKRRGEQFKFDDIVIKLNDIEHYSHSSLEIRYLSIRQFGVKHDVIHYYYTGWPDFNVVEAKQLLTLIDIVNKHGSSQSLLYNKTTNSSLLIPIVVHCSAGVGRTGTYITVDTIVRLLDRPIDKLKTFELDVMAIVYQLRRQRVSMVQTKEQYLLVYRCVEEYLKQTVSPDSQPTYENLKNCSLTSTPHDYTNSFMTTGVRINHSNIDQVSSYTNSKTERPFPERINSRTSQVVNHHSYRSRARTRRPTYDDSLQNNYYRTTSNDNGNDYPLPPLPPRRNTSTQSYPKVHQRNS